MKVTREELAAYADGNLDARRAAEVAAHIATDAALAREVHRHRELKARLATHFLHIPGEPVPEELATMLLPRSAPVTNLAIERQKRENARRIPGWGWIVGPALAASLALAVSMRTGADRYVEGPLSNALSTQLASNQSAADPVRIILSFQDEMGAFCRVFVAREQSGIACRDEHGWLLAYKREGLAPKNGEFRTAGNPSEVLLQRAQALAVGPALDAEQERAALEREWLSPTD